MSTHCLNLAFKSEVKKSSLKFILVALADYANEDHEAYPSIQTLVRKTALDRKTVQAGLNELVELGYIYDTRLRRGSTKGVKVWKLTIERSQKWDSLSDPKNGTPSDPKNGITKRSQKRDIEPSSFLTTRVTKEKEKKESNEKPKNQTARGTRLSPDWQPTQEDLKYIKERRPDLNIQDTSENFRDYWISIPGQKGLKLDWAATWRTWVRNDKGGAKKTAQNAKFNAGSFLAEKQRIWREQNG